MDYMEIEAGWVEEFPDDLWQIIFDHARLQKFAIKPEAQNSENAKNIPEKDAKPDQLQSNQPDASPIPPQVSLLALRTVCRAWNKLICLFPKINSQGIKDHSRLPQLFPCLRSFNIVLAPPANDFEDMIFTGSNLTLLTGLHSLTLDDSKWTGRTQPPNSRDMKEFSCLTSLTKLTLSSKRVTSLGPLTRLRCLSLKAPWAINLSQVTRLSHLTTLKRYSGYEQDLFAWNYTGHGTIIVASSSGSPKQSYKGGFHDGLPHGYGVATWSQDGEYRGHWKDGQRHGHGLETWYDGSRYEGDHKDGYKSGRGTMFYASGNRYEGLWAKGEKNGAGVYYFKKNGGRCEGTWVDDQQQGFGRQYWAKGDRYEGNFQDDVKSGPGVLYYPDGPRYEGPFLENARHGFGILYYPNSGVRFECSYMMDKRTGMGVVHFPENGDRFECAFHEHKPQGNGILYFMDGKGNQQQKEMSFEEMGKLKNWGP